MKKSVCAVVVVGLLVVVVGLLGSSDAAGIRLRTKPKPYELPARYHECDGAPFGTFVIDLNYGTSTHIVQTLLERNWTQKNVSDCALYDLKWTWSFSRAKALLPCQMVNHFPNAELTIGSKDGLWEIIGAGAYEFVPDTWNLEHGAVELPPRASEHGRLGQYYVSKKSNQNRGVGIQVLYVPSRGYRFPKEPNRILQTYVANPLLLPDGRKFDIRIFALVTSLDPLVAFLSTDFYTRHAAHPYELFSNEQIARIESSDEPYVVFADIYSQLTNKQVSKQVSTDTLQWPSEQLIAWIGREKYDEVVRPQLKEIARKTLQAWSDKWGSRDHRMRSFELLGFDILLDDNLKAWLIEVNIAPGQHLNSPVVKIHHPRMIKDMFSVVLDHENACPHMVGVFENIACGYATATEEVLEDGTVVVSPEKDEL
eukprot:ANDGO_02950.mRNA.1 Tubulin polyglutamylase ttll-4